MKIAEDKDCIKRTINKHIENKQQPYFKEHLSMKGWSSMNYPSFLTNPILRPPPAPLDRNYPLDTLYQNELKMDEIAKRVRANERNIEALFRDKGEKPKDSNYTLATTSAASKGKSLIRNQNELEKLADIKPAWWEGKSKEGPIEIGSISIPRNPNEHEERRHLRGLARRVISEDFVAQSLGDEVFELDLRNKQFIREYVLHRIGFLAPNLIVEPKLIPEH